MPNNEKLLEQRTTWLKACAALTERIKEREEGVVRLDAAVKRAEERVAADRAKLEEMVAAERAAADDFLREAEEPEAAQAKRFIEDQEKAAKPKEIDRSGDAVAERIAGELQSGIERRLDAAAPGALRDLKTGEALAPQRPVAMRDLHLNQPVSGVAPVKP